jgi:hypothetical protein
VSGVVGVGGRGSDTIGCGGCGGGGGEASSALLTRVLSVCSAQRDTSLFQLRAEKQIGRHAVSPRPCVAAKYAEK